MGTTEIFTQSDRQRFDSGELDVCQQLLGCHYIEEDEQHRFSVWAPSAQAVHLVGDFNSWDDTATPMQQQGGIYSCQVSGVKNGGNYKYLVTGADGVRRYKADPYALYSEVWPDTASRVWDITHYAWQDSIYMRKRGRRPGREDAVNIYQMHPSSWRRHDDGTAYTYRDLAQELPGYLKQMGFTHVLFMPICEHPHDGSLGYRVAGLFAPLSQMGTPQELMYLIDMLHREGIGALLDFPGAALAEGQHTLVRFDGTDLYEQPPQSGQPPLLDLQKPQVQSYLLSAACFWLRTYHLDGLCLDGTSHQSPGDTSFVRRLAAAARSIYPRALLIARGGEGDPALTLPQEEGGVGFDMVLRGDYPGEMAAYVQMDHLFRRDYHDKPVLPIDQRGDNTFLLGYPYSQVMGGRHSMIEGCFGDYWQKFATLRALYGLLYAQPGKKLLFMGDEFAQFVEWDTDGSLDWFLHEYDSHAGMSRYIARLGRILTKYRALYEDDRGDGGCSWLQRDDRDNSVLVFMRNSRPWRGRVQHIVCAVNFTPVVRYHYTVGLPGKGVLREILSSDDARYGGSGVKNAKEIAVRGESYAGFAASAEITLPPLGAAFFEYVPASRLSGTGRAKN